MFLDRFQKISTKALYVDTSSIHFSSLYPLTCTYSKTCLQQPLKRPSDGGLCRQVVLTQKCIDMTEVACVTDYSGHYRQVVFLMQVLFKTSFTVHTYCTYVCIIIGGI